jgi:quercetin dioxygenase-like cupin family protein
VAGMIIKNLEEAPIDPMDKAINTYIQWLISPLDGEERIGLRRFIIKPGGEIPPHIHEELYHIQFVLKGHYLIGNDKEKKRVSPGTVIYIPPKEIHWYKNDEEEEGVFLCIIPLDKSSSIRFIDLKI